MKEKDSAGTKFHSLGVWGKETIAKDIFLSLKNDDRKPMEPIITSGNSQTSSDEHLPN